MSTVTLSLPLASSQSTFRLSDSRSARWFVEALQLIRRFDETRSKEMLTQAAALLEECNRHYPQDALPRFYLGVAYSVLGDQHQDFAIKVFKEFATSNVFAIRAVASYNLASSYIETYEPELFRRAIAVLNRLEDDLKRGGAPIAQHAWVRVLLGLFGQAKPPVEPLYYQLLETRAYLVIHLEVFVPRWTGELKKVIESAEVQRAALKERCVKLRRDERFLGSQGPEIWAWLQNNLGNIEGGMAIAALREGRQEAAQEYARAAGDAYQAALVADPRFTSALSNIGRLNFEVTRNYQAAKDAFESGLFGVEDVDYNHYYLGLLSTINGDQHAAIEHFRRAPVTVARRGSQATWEGARNMLDAELRKIGRGEEARELMRKLPIESAADKPDDD